MNIKKLEKLSLPGSIIIAGALIALAVIFTSGSNDVSPNSQVAQNQPSLENVSKITKKDNVLGDPKAPITIVEYSDYECPFCKRFHETMNQVMDKYGDDGKVAWVYRHFPLDALHPVKARLEAVTSECVAEIGGNDAFWEFSNKFFELTPSNNRTDLEVVLPQIISDMGLSQSKIDECVASGRYDKEIEDQIANAQQTGGQGTPWSVIIMPDGKKYPLNGAQPYEAIESLIELGLK